MNTAFHRAHDVHAASICVFFFLAACSISFYSCVHQISKFPGCNISLNEKNHVSDHYLALKTYEEHHSLLVFCTSFKFDRHYACSCPLLFALIFLACLLTLKFVVLTVSHLDVRDHEGDAKQANIG